MRTCKVWLLNSKDEVQYGLNWGQRENRDPNQSYLQLEPEVYNGDFFPVKGKYFIVETDDNETIIFNRAQKEKGCALQTPENNAILGGYIRKRLGIVNGAEIVKDDILNYGRDFITFTKIDDLHYKLDFSNGSETKKIFKPTKPLQQILFGAPGTGKSHTINSDADITEQNSIRTTFHPDSDYSTFVGCYKPTKKEKSKGVLTPLNDLISISKEQSTTEQKVKFISKYAESIKAAAKENDLSDNQIIRDPNYFGWNSDTYLMNFLNEILEERAKIDDSEITYDFTPQAFTNAYVAAWKDLDNPFYLIIEEINRGNCAQIFGDIFQLLDRNEQGYSSYKTTPDQDLAKYIREQFADTDIEDADVKSGKKMQLPPNLHIWATMNTSDQSLFPIDSAFKRRWDWRYIPIDYTDRGHYIACGDTQYSWADFLQKVNDKVEAVTQSEDKKLGYWFMGNGAEQKEITIERFVSKVVFYLWNDVFKDFGKSGNTIFKDSFAKFHLFFDFSGKPKVDVVKAFLDALEVKGIVINNEEYENSDIEESDSKGSPYTYKLDGVFIKGIGQVVRKTIEELCQTMNFDDILNDFNSIVKKTYQNGSAMRLGTAQELGKDANGRNRWWKDPFTSKDGKIFSVTALWPDSDFARLKKFVEHYPSIFPGGLVQEVAEQ